ncbi:uncharacterized protein LOC143036783 [Oratosquilla oratoria]|uniref:uncharacterized protein LOC143036783 n=1 Tax=Oratosquilla oratoria TaxID=337810 RepID=UPI003F776F90
MVPGKARPRGGLLLCVFVLVLLLDGLVAGDRVKVKDENRGSEGVNARKRLARVPDAAEGSSRGASDSWKDLPGLPELFSKKAEKSPAEEADVEEPRDDPGVLSGIYSRMKNWMFPNSSQETRKKLSDFRKRLAKRTKSIVHTYTSLRDTVLPDKKGFDAPNFGYTRSGLDLVGYRKAQVPDLRPAELETSGDLVIRKKRALSLDTLIYGGSGVVYQATGVENAGKIGLGGYEDLKLVNFKNHLVAVTRDAEDEIVVHVAWNEDLQFVRSRVALGGTKFLLTVVGKVNNPGDLETDALLIAYIPTPDEVDARVMIDELVLQSGTVERNHLQTIFGMTPSCLHAWKFAGEDFLLLMGSEPCATSTDPNERCVDVYAFMGTYFDKKAIFDAPASSYIEPVIVGETLYIVTVVKDGNGSDDAESNVYEYKEELVSQSKGFEFSHSIVTRGAVHATSFTLGPREDREVFLVVANNCEDRVGEVGCDPHTKSTIFKHHEGKFHIFQNIDTYGAVQWHPLQVGSSVFLLLVSLAEDESKSVEVFHYDGSRFVTVDEIDDFQPGTVGVSSVSFHQRTYIGMACPKCDADNLYELIYTYENRAQNFRRSLGQWCNETLQALETSPTNISTLLDQARQMPGVEPGQIDFSDRDLVMENVTIDDLTILESGLVQLDLENLTDTSNGLRELVDNLTQKMETKLRVGISTWPERLTFDMLVLEDANVENLSVGMFGEEKAITWDDVVPLNGTQPLTLTQTFNDLVLTSSTEVDKLNGLPLADYMTVNGSFISPHKLIVEGVLQVDKLQVDGTVDSVTFDHQTILFVDGIQSLQGK